MLSVEREDERETARDELETEKSTRHRSLVCKDKPRCRRPPVQSVPPRAVKVTPTFLCSTPPRPPGPLPRARTRAFVPRACERLVFVVRVSLVRAGDERQETEHRKHHPTATTNKTNVRYLGVGRCRAREESRRVGGGNERAKGDGAMDKHKTRGAFVQRR